MSRLFISHSSKNDDWAIALRDWLVREGWSGADDIFLDLDPERGIVAGQKWVRALEDAATRCEAVLFLVSEHWLASTWCFDEYQLAKELHTKLFALLIDDVARDRLPGGLTAQWQIVRLKGEQAERFLTIHPLTQHQSPVHIAKAGLTSLKLGLQKAGIRAETFELQPDRNGPFGWRAPYPGLEALEPEDAAVFFGRNADIVRGIDELRRLAARRPPRVLVVLGASGAGKSSFLRAGLWPRLLRDDSQWLPLRAIRAGRGGAIEGSEGLLAALEEVHRRFALRASPADLRERLTTPDSFVALLCELREAAARRALITEPPYPLPILCLDQGEELFAADTGAESETLLKLTREAIDAGQALLLVTIRSDSYGLMQAAQIFAGVEQVPLSLGPVPRGEIGNIVREPAEILRAKAGPQAPVFDAAVVARLQAEIAGEEDALPLLAFVMQRLMREHAAASAIGLTELERTGGVGAAIESAADAALADAGIGRDRSAQRDMLRRLFIPRLARVDPESKVPQRRATPQADISRDLLPLARALTERRLLVVKLAAREAASPDAATIEVAHEALLRRWPTLAELLTEDRDALLLLDGVISAATDWAKADEARKTDFLAHRGSRLADAQALSTRGTDWAREIVPARAYLAACQGREEAERGDKEATLARQLRDQRRIAFGAIAAALLMAVVGGFAWLKWGEADRATQLAQQQKQLAAVQLEEAQREQSRHLENLARQKLETDDGTALLLAVEGLPGGTTAVSRPYIPQAELDLDLAWRLLRERRILVGHEDAVWSAAFSPDGKRIVTASLDKTARVWDVETGKQIGEPLVHESAVWSAAFSPDGKRVVTVVPERSVRLWDAETGRQIGPPLGRWDRSAAFSPDGKRIVTASFDTALLWDAETHQQIGAPLTGHEGAVKSAAFSPDGRRIITASNDKTARLWDAETHQQIGAPLTGHEGAVKSAAFSPDGRLIVTASEDKTARLWDAETHQQIGAPLEGHNDIVFSAAFRPDGKHIVTASRDGTARLWDAATGKQISELVGHDNSVLSAAFSPDGKRIVTASPDRTARLWEASPIRLFGMPLVGHEDRVNSAAFSPDGKRIVTASDDKTARLWDAETGKQIGAPLVHTNLVISAAFSPDGKRIVTASSYTPRLWDAETHEEIGTPLVGHKDFVTSAAFSPDGKRILTVSGGLLSLDKTARLWDAETHRQIGAPLTGVDSAAFSPDGKLIVTASDDKTARLWDAETHEKIGAPLVGHEDSVNSAAFSPDGTRVVTASLDKTARLWDVQTGKQIGPPLVHEGDVTSAAFSPDGKRIVTASRDTVRLWDAETHEEIGTPLVGREDSVNVKSAAFSPDGKRIVTAWSDNAARLQSVFATTQELVSASKVAVPRCLTPAQRATFFLAPERPAWCIQMQKWPFLPVGYRGLGDAYYAKRDYDHAIADYTEAISLNPKYALAYESRGNAYEAKKDYQHATDDFGEAIHLDPTDPNYLSERCRARALAGADLQGALADCNESLRLRPDDRNTFNNRGLVQLKLGVYDRAIADYSAAMTDENYWNSLYGRGIAKLKSGDTAGGNADIAEAKAREPDIAEVYAGYGVR